MTMLLGCVARGELPPPDVVAGELVWPINYAWKVRKKGAHLPGTFPGLPPGVTGTGELRRWRVVHVGHAFRYVRFRSVVKTRSISKEGGAS
jgi:hypothetical protein